MEQDSECNVTDMEKLTKFSVSVALRRFLEDDGGGGGGGLTAMRKYLTVTDWNSTIVNNCLNDIARIMLLHGSTVVDQRFVSLFEPVLLDLLSRAAGLNDEPEITHLLMCVLLGRIVTGNRTVLQYVFFFKEIYLQFIIGVCVNNCTCCTCRFTMKYFQNNPSPFHSDPGLEPALKRSRMEVGVVQPSEFELAQCSWNILRLEPEHFKNAWNWSDFAEHFASSSDPKVRWIACRCLALVSNMSEEECCQLISQSVGEEEDRIMTISCCSAEDCRSGPNRPSSVGDSSRISKDVLSGGVVDVEGVLLPRFCQVLKYY